jgi:tetratricopeptide (TPR) repeat protein
MADSAPVMLVFEDMQWADQALLDFVEYLLEWSRDLPLFVLVLARPELGDLRPGWGTSSRSHMSLVLEPLSGPVMHELLTAMRLPDEVIGPIAERAEGVPLYAVETVRMLIDRGALVPTQSGFEAAAEVGTPEIPETLHALVLARLDALPAAERALLQDASVLGKTFTVEGLTAVSGIPTDQIDPRLELLVRRELLSIDIDPRSPERGQYGFVQALVRTVAYETMGLRDRKRRHLAAAAHLASIDQGDELVELIATHTLDAHRAVPEDEDADGLRDQARELLLRAAMRARSLGAPAEAKRLTLTALELADDETERARVLELACDDALALGNPVGARELAELALSIHRRRGDEAAAAHVLASIADAMFLEGRSDEAATLMREAYDGLRSTTAGAELAEVAAQYGRQLLLSGSAHESGGPLEHAIELAEALRLPGVLSDALNTYALRIVPDRPESARTLLEGALRIALEGDQPRAAMRAYFNLSYVCECTDRDGREIDGQGLAVAERLGDRQWERSFQSHLIIYELLQGDWDSVLARVERLIPEHGDDVFVAHGWLFAAQVLLRRGQLDEAREAIAASGVAITIQDPQLQLLICWTTASMLIAEGRPADAAATAAAAVRSPLHAYTMPTVFTCASALVATADRAGADELRAGLEAAPEGLRPPTSRAILMWLRACFDELDDPDAAFAEAISGFAAIPRPWNQAEVLESHAASLRERGRSQEAAARLAEAEALYERLGARPALERVRASFAERAVS